MTVNVQPGMDMETIGEVCDRYLATEWQPLYEAMREELAAAFAEIEDAAYGMYLDRLMPPLFEALEQAGYSFADETREDDFVIGGRLLFRQSLEKWGSEDDRSRVFWNVIADASGKPIGALLTETPHSHLTFDIPRAPRIFGIADVRQPDIADRIRARMEGNRK